MMSPQIAAIGLALTSPGFVETDYEKMLALFNGATEKAELKDLGKYEDHNALNPWTCVIMGPGQTREQAGVMTLNSLEYTLPGTPSLGPLFPGTPDSKATKVVFGGNFISSRKFTADQLTMYNTRLEGNTWVNEIVPNDEGIFSDVGGEGTVRLRKTGPYLALTASFPKHKATEESPNQFAGYCYRNEGTGCVHEYDTNVKVLRKLFKNVEHISMGGQIKNGDNIRGQFGKICDNTWVKSAAQLTDACKKAADYERQACLDDPKIAHQSCVSTLGNIQCRDSADGRYFKP